MIMHSDWVAICGAGPNMALVRTRRDARLVVESGAAARRTALR